MTEHLDLSSSHYVSKCLVSDRFAGTVSYRIVTEGDFMVGLGDRLALAAPASEGLWVRQAVAPPGSAGISLLRRGARVSPSDAQRPGPSPTARLAFAAAIRAAHLRQVARRATSPRGPSLQVRVV